MNKAKTREDRKRFMVPDTKQYFVLRSSSIELAASAETSGMVPPLINEKGSKGKLEKYKTAYRGGCLL